MNKYIITIVNLKTNTIHQLTKDDDNINTTIKKELGGWDNLKGATTTNPMDNKNYQSSGTTKDNKYMYSILCYLENK